MPSRFAYLRTLTLAAVAVAMGTGIGLLGCAATQIGATPDELARAQAQSAQGAMTFKAECASCHGERGEGLASAPAIMGPGALPEYPRTTGAGDPTLTDPQLLQIQAQTRPQGAAWRDPFRNAQDLFTFMTTHLPKSRAAALTPADYWAVVSYLLAAQGATLPPAGLDQASGASVPIPKR
jgi:mono/diheme cytochrome c family protein